MTCFFLLKKIKNKIRRARQYETKQRERDWSCARGQKLRANLFWGGVKPVKLNLSSTVLVIMDNPKQKGKKKSRKAERVVFSNRLLAYHGAGVRIYE